MVLGIFVVLFVRRPGSTDQPLPPAVSASEPGAAAAPATPLPTPVPTPIPTAAPVATVVAPVLSMESGGQPARVSLDLQHPFASGTVRIKVDDRVVFASNIHGMPKKVLGVLSGYDGRFGTELAIPAGEHMIQVEVRSGSTEFVESRRVSLKGGDSRRLLALVGKGMTLSLE